MRFRAAKTRLPLRPLVCSHIAERRYAMSDNIENAVLDELHAMQAAIAQIQDKLGVIELRLDGLAEGMTELRQAQAEHTAKVALLESRMDSLDARMARVEARVVLHEEQDAS